MPNFIFNFNTFMGLKIYAFGVIKEKTLKKDQFSENQNPEEILRIFILYNCSRGITGC